MSELINWLKRNRLEKYSDVFIENEIELEDLPDLTEDDLNSLGIPMGPRKRFLRSIADLHKKPAATAEDNTADSDSLAVTTPAFDDAAHEAERRQLTVMFCDLAGSTALAERLDPEDMRDVITRFQNRCREVIEHFGGFIARYVGDAVLVYFGYPQAHEDDAERAVRAGLDIIVTIEDLESESEHELKVRIGIATGLVVAGDLIGEGASQERAVVGETPNLAARLQGVAEPNTVVIAAGTEQLVGALFNYQPLHNLELKGISNPTQAWRVLGESKMENRFEAAAARGLTPLIGREEEIDLLLKRWEQTVEGEGQVVLLSGEAGIGKSRILRGFSERMQGKIHNRILYFASPYHQNTALHPAIDQLKRGLRFEEDDDKCGCLDKIDEALLRLSLEPRELAPVLATLLSITSDGRYPSLALPPGEVMTKTLQTLFVLIEAMATQNPVLMVVEDLQFLDASTQELLDILVERTASLPILLILTYRLEFEPPWLAHGHVTLITLNRLSRRQTIALVNKVSGNKTMPEELVTQIVAKTDGVALFVEELTKTVIESGLLQDAGDHYALTGPLPPLAVPASLQDSLMARLDRLSPVKEVAQLAAVIGRYFSLELLAAASPMSRDKLEMAMSRLVEAELIHRRMKAEGIGYEFKHALVRDAAYASLLRAKRNHYHNRIAKVLEKEFPQYAETEPALLAYHYAEAGLPSRATVYWLKAGERLHDQGSVKMSMAAYEKALEMATEDEDRCHALIGLAGNMRVIDDYNKALEALDEAQRIASNQNLTRALARIHHLRGNLYFPLGNVSGCLDEHEKAFHFAQSAGDTENSARALSGLGDAQYSRGHMRTALDYFCRCVELAKQHDYLQIAVGNQYMVAWTRLYINEVYTAKEDALAAVDAAVELNYLRAEMVARLSISRILVELAELQEAERQIDRGLNIAEMLGANRFKPFLMIFRACVQIAQNGPQTETVALMEQALQISRDTSIGFLGPWVLGTLALSHIDADCCKEALKEGESVLAGDCVGHNYFAFYRTAMEASLRFADWDAVDRYAGILETYCQQAEPLPRSEFYISRGRVLAKLGRCVDDQQSHQQLVELRRQAASQGLLAAIPAMDAVLAA